MLTTHRTLDLTAATQSVSSPIGTLSVAPESGWQRLSPALRAAIITFFFVFGLRAVSQLLGSTLCVFGLPFTLITYFVQGTLVGRFAKDDPRYSLRDYPRLGLLSALWTSGISLGLQLALLALQLMTLYVIALLPLVLLDMAAGIFLNVCFTAMGAWIYGRTGGKGLVGITIGVLTLGTLVVCLMALAALAILAAIGFTVFQGVST